MKYVLIAFLLSFALNISAQVSDSFRSLFAICGTWGMETKKGMLYESWEKINDSTLQGRSFRLNGYDTIIIEDAQLVSRNGLISFNPVVANQNSGMAVTFKLLKVENNEYIFENPGHDFPQRVIYRLPSGNMMHARIEGVNKGQAAKSEFNYTRVE